METKRSPKYICMSGGQPTIIPGTSCHLCYKAVKAAIKSGSNHTWICNKRRLTSPCRTDRTILTRICAYQKDEEEKPLFHVEIYAKKIHIFYTLEWDVSEKKNKIHYKTCCHHFNRKIFEMLLQWWRRHRYFLSFFTVCMNDIGSVRNII